MEDSLFLQQHPRPFKARSVLLPPDRFQMAAAALQTMAVDAAKIFQSSTVVAALDMQPLQVVEIRRALAPPKPLPLAVERAMARHVR